MGRSEDPKSRSGTERFHGFLSWLLLWAFLVSVCWIIINQPLADYFSFQIVLISPSSSRQKQQREPILPSIAGTTIRGSSSVALFRSYLHCMSESGRWVYNATPRHIPWNYAAEKYTERCEERHHGLRGNDAEKASLTAQNWTVREELKWVWQTNESCPNQPVNRDEFCKLLGRRGNVMVVGDSINHGLQWSITNNLIKDPSAQTIIKAEDPVSRTCPGSLVCGDVVRAGRGFNVSFVRNDRLSAIGKARDDRVANFLEWPWMEYIREWNVKMLILNRGAHYEADEIVLRALNSTFSYIKKQHPELLVLFRNTPPGHLNCMIHKKPLERRHTFSINGDDNKYHWGDFQRQNLLVKGLVEEFGFIYVDADSLLSRRADGHVHGRDCLHYCIPGPLDSVVQLLYNILRAIPSM